MQPWRGDIAEEIVGVEISESAAFEAEEEPGAAHDQIGNAAGLGSKLALISRTKREEAIQIAKQVTYIEMATFPDFSTMFANAMYLN